MSTGALPNTGAGSSWSRGRGTNQEWTFRLPVSRFSLSLSCLLDQDEAISNAASVASMRSLPHAQDAARPSGQATRASMLHK
jgi:hypothetical protein